MDITSERLAYWFLRLNGFFTIYNFIVHPEAADTDGRYRQQTDVDVMGVRLPYRRENRKRPMEDHPLFRTECMQFALAETKSSTCGLNDSWRDAARENMQKALSAAGIVPPQDVDKVAAQLYASGQFRTDALWVRWLFFGRNFNSDLQTEFPDVPQLLWANDVLPFIHERFNGYRLEKRAHNQWDDDAKGLFSVAVGTRDDVKAFLGQVTVDGRPVQ